MVEFLKLNRMSYSSLKCGSVTRESLASMAFRDLQKLAGEQYNIKARSKRQLMDAIMEFFDQESEALDTIEQPSFLYSTPNKENEKPSSLSTKRFSRSNLLVDISFPEYEDSDNTTPETFESGHISKAINQLNFLSEEQENTFTKSKDKEKQKLSPVVVLHKVDSVEDVDSALKERRTLSPLNYSLRKSDILENLSPPKDLESEDDEVSFRPASIALFQEPLPEPECQRRSTYSLSNKKSLVPLPCIEDNSDTEPESPKRDSAEASHASLSLERTHYQATNTELGNENNTPLQNLKDSYVSEKLVEAGRKSESATPFVNRNVKATLKVVVRNCNSPELIAQTIADSYLAETAAKRKLSESGKKSVGVTSPVVKDKIETKHIAVSNTQHEKTVTPVGIKGDAHNSFGYVGTQEKTIAVTAAKEELHLETSPVSGLNALETSEVPSPALDVTITISPAVTTDRTPATNVVKPQIQKGTVTKAKVRIAAGKLSVGSSKIPRVKNTPNFAKIHKKQFDKMENIEDFLKRRYRGRVEQKNKKQDVQEQRVNLNKAEPTLLKRAEHKVLKKEEPKVLRRSPRNHETSKLPQPQQIYKPVEAKPAVFKFKGSPKPFHFGFGKPVVQEAKQPLLTKKPLMVQQPNFAPANKKETGNTGLKSLIRADSWKKAAAKLPQSSKDTVCGGQRKLNQMVRMNKRFELQMQQRRMNQ